MSNSKKLDPFEYHNGFEKYSNVRSILIHDGGITEKPSISIMIPTFRRPDMLKQAIDSALSQKTDVLFEVVVVDNESAADTTRKVDEIIKSSKANNIRLFRNEKNIGMFGNWNRCIELANSDWITLLSDDDILEPNFIENTINHITSNEFIGCNVNHFGTMLPPSNKKNYIKKLARTTIYKFWYKKDIREIKLADLIIGNPVTGTLGVIFNKNSAINIGGFNENYWPSSDYLFFSKYWFKYGGKVTSKKLAGYRWDVNESLKLETVIGFIEINCKIRTGILEKLAKKTTEIKVIQKSLRFLKLLQANLYISNYNMKDQHKVIFSFCGLPNLKLPFPQTLSWLFLGILYILDTKKPRKNRETE